MGGAKHRVPLGHFEIKRDLNDGTLVRNQSPLPGPIGGVIAIADAPMQRAAAKVRKASASKYIYTGQLKLDVAKADNLYKGKLTKLTLKNFNETGQVWFDKLLNFIITDPEIKDLRWIAYMLATVKRECGNTWAPIEEYGKGKGHAYGKAIKIKDSAGKEHTNAYYGRGYVQLTWESNYKTMSKALGYGEDLWIHPERALEPEIAYKIMSYGMRHGSFTGKKLSSYIKDDTCDYKNARRIINGLDHWQEIKGAAEGFEAILLATRIEQQSDDIPD
ncbi:MAG: hypothetical protein WCB68_03675 [Pyrinomonadaceae bacterium]